MPHVEALDEVSRQGVGGVKLHRSHHVLFAADPEQLALDRIDAPGTVDAVAVVKDLVVRLGQAPARSPAVGRCVLGTVWHPVIVHARLANRAGDVLGNPPRRDTVPHPELADTGIGMRQGKPVVGVRVGEIGRVEIEPHRGGLGPVDPAREMFRFQRIAIDLSPAGFGVAGMDIDLVLAGYEGEHLVQVGPHLVTVAGAARVVAGRHDPAAAGTVRGFEPGHVVALPAVDRDRDRQAGRDRLVGIHPQPRVVRAGGPVGLFDLFVGQRVVGGHADSPPCRLPRMATRINPGPSGRNRPARDR